VKKRVEKIAVKMYCAFQGLFHGTSSLPQHSRMIERWAYNQQGFALALVLCDNRWCLVEPSLSLVLRVLNINLYRALAHIALIRVPPHPISKHQIRPKYQHAITQLTYSTSESANPVSRPLFFTPKKALSWHCYLEDRQIEFSKNLICHSCIYKLLYLRILVL